MEEGSYLEIFVSDCIKNRNWSINALESLYKTLKQMTILMIFFFIFRWKQVLIFHVNRLLGRRFTWNIKTCFLWKMKKCRLLQILFSALRDKVLCIRRFKDGPQKCCVQTKMFRLYRPFMVTFLYNLYNFVWIQQGCLVNTVLSLDPAIVL